MGGVGAHEYMAPCPAGENDVALAPGYAANVEVASAEPAPVELPEPLSAPEEVPTPGLTTIAEVAGKLGLPEGALLKAFPVIAEGRGLVLVVVRGDHQINDIKLTNALGTSFRAAREDEFAQRIGPAGSMGPVGADVPVLLDDAVAPGPVRHRRQPRGPPPARGRAGPRLPLQARRRPPRRARRHGRRPPDPHRARDRGRQHLQARHALLRGVRRDLPRRVRGRAADLDGLLRHRARAHLRRRRSSSSPTSRGSRGRSSISPWDVHLVGLGSEGTEERALADRLYDELREAGLDVIYDDRDLGPGSKFADAELLGCPLRLTVGKRSLASGEIEAQVRRGQESRALPLEGAAQAAMDLWQTLA